jgi:hypothetical protein
MGEKKSSFMVLVGKSEGHKPLKVLGLDWRIVIK